MTADQWFQLFQVAQSIVMALAMGFAWFWGHERQQQRELSDRRFDALEERFNRAGRLTSDLGTQVQGLVGRLDRLPEDLRSRFLSLDRATDLLEESRRDRLALWEELKSQGRHSRPR